LRKVYSGFDIAGTKTVPRCGVFPSCWGLFEYLQNPAAGWIGYGLQNEVQGVFISGHDATRNSAKIDYSQYKQVLARKYAFVLRQPRATMRAMQVEDLLKSFQSKSDEELLRLSLHIGQLTPEATLALRSELTRRRIADPEKLNAFRVEEMRRKVEDASDPGSMFFFSRLGIGRMRFGKADYFYNPKTRLEEFRTTVFVVLFWLPLIPTGTYRVERKRKLFFRKNRFLEKLPLDWGQVLRVWLVAAAIILALIAALLLLAHSKA